MFSFYNTGIVRMTCIVMKTVDRRTFVYVHHIIICVVIIITTILYRKRYGNRFSEIPIVHLYNITCVVYTVYTYYKATEDVYIDMYIR